jgi:hypothetical protein
MMMPLCTSTNISEELTASDFMVTLGHPDNLGSKPIWNILTPTNPNWVKSKETDLCLLIDCP